MQPKLSYIDKNLLKQSIIIDSHWGSSMKSFHYELDNESQQLDLSQLQTI